MSQHDFRTKALAIAEQRLPDLINKEDSLVEISGEKKTTIKNWLYSDKRPPRGKRLTIADRFGVDVSYLFDNAPYSLPLTKFDESLNCYFVPELKLSQITCLSETAPLPISARVTISLPTFILDNMQSVEQTYCVVSSGIDYEPFITATDTIFFNTTAKRIKGNFYILVSSDTSIVRMESDGTLKCNQGKSVSLASNDKIIPIVITLSSGFAR
ncbi:hypothetical protein D5018_19035 [Parashewanella curva]|uniref:Uncharacterized protein n=1 Tax=Parashewanella curva TaxID=2338552 RepID=A0A3L8PRS6_9GAMM|nr:hypothetical protein [Parashewanella curva]RLV58117.1 hypothetical protein D5018_19035 [Parashewanella curva]